MLTGCTQLIYQQYIMCTLYDDYVQIKVIFNSAVHFSQEINRLNEENTKLRDRIKTLEGKV